VHLRKFVEINDCFFDVNLPNQPVHNFLRIFTPD